MVKILYGLDGMRDASSPNTDRSKEELRTAKQQRAEEAKAVLLRHKRRKMSLADWQKHVADRYEPD